MQKSYKVLRHMQGDRDYKPGDTRELSDAEAEPLLRGGSIELLDDAEGADADKPAARKAAKPHANKAEPAPSNKSE